MSLFSKLSPLNLLKKKKHVDPELFQSHVLLGLDGWRRLFESTPNEEEIEMVRESLWRTGSMAKDLQDPIVSKYWQCHFLSATADLLGNFYEEHATVESHYWGAALEMASLENNGGLRHEPLVISVDHSQAEWKLSADAYWGAAVAHYNQHLDKKSPALRGYLNSAVSSLEHNDYWLNKRFYLTLQMASLLIMSSENAEHWKVTLGAFGTAMNDLTSSKDFGYTPFDAVREHKDAALMMDFTLYGLKAAGFIEKAAQLEEEILFRDIEKPWRKDPNSQYRRLIQSMEEQ